MVRRLLIPSSTRSQCLPLSRNQQARSRCSPESWGWSFWSETSLVLDALATPLLRPPLQPKAGGCHRQKQQSDSKPVRSARGSSPVSPPGRLPPLRRQYNNGVHDGGDNYACWPGKYSAGDKFPDRAMLIMPVMLLRTAGNAALERTRQHWGQMHRLGQGSRQVVPAGAGYPSSSQNIEAADVLAQVARYLVVRTPSVPTRHLRHLRSNAGRLVHALRQHDTSVNHQRTNT